ncbi:MAG: glucosidase, partial [Verrucomicrobiota bacterium]
MADIKADNAEALRLKSSAQRSENWKRWGPYLAERQWGTVREDYSSNSDAWNSFPYEHSTKRAYRWGEDGLLGYTDRRCRLCVAPALWNGQDTHLKERLFGLTGPEGNHGEDVKELYYYLDSSPTHSYAKALYKYPQAAFPYESLRAHSRARGLNDPEFEIEETGLFDEGRYFDLQVEYAKASPNDLLIRYRVTNHGPDAAPIHILPTVWYRNTWAWGCEHEGCTPKPSMRKTGPNQLTLDHDTLGRFYFFAEGDDFSTVSAEWLFTENESNTQAIWGEPTYTPYVKDAFHRRVVHGEKDAVNPDLRGTKAALWFQGLVEPGATVEIRCRLCSEAEQPADAFGADFDKIFSQRIEDTDTYYAALPDVAKDTESERIQRQAYAGLLWTKQFFHFSVNDWLKGDQGAPPPPSERLKGRNKEWKHLFAHDVLSMPDKWEYPWFAAWDLAFHMIPFARIDEDFAKWQLLLILREWYMHPNGQIPAYEWNFSDVNPPVHAWAVWRVYQISAETGEPDLAFLKQGFLKLLLNFTWWVNRKDESGNNLFSGGFLGLDNIGAFDRSKPLPDGAKLQQADGTAWMAFYCTTMLRISLELAKTDPAYDSMASKFFEHFMNIADAMNTVGESGLWNTEDGFYNDELKTNGQSVLIRIRSLVGLIPLIAVEILDQSNIAMMPGFRSRMEWFLKHRKDLGEQISLFDCDSSDNAFYLLAIPSRERLEQVLQKLLDESDFLSPYGIRSLSKYHEANPF